MERQLSRIGHLSSPGPKVWRAYAALARVSPSYSPLQGRLPTCYSPVRRSTRGPKATFALDLHVSGTPPAFILSQDQTLQLNPACAPGTWLGHGHRGAVTSAFVASGNDCSRSAIAGARPGRRSRHVRHRRGVVSLSDVIFDGRRGRRGIDADSFLYSVFKEPAIRGRGAAWAQARRLRRFATCPRPALGSAPQGTARGSAERRRGC